MTIIGTGAQEKYICLLTSEEMGRVTQCPWGWVAVPMSEVRELDITHLPLPPASCMSMDIEQRKALLKAVGDAGLTHLLNLDDPENLAKLREAIT